MVSAASSTQRKKLRRKVASGAAKIMRKYAKAPTKAESKASGTKNKRRRVKAIVQSLTPAQRKKVIAKLQAKKKARAAKKRK